ncbi:carbamate kinase [Thermodesulfobacteriota bacterium]
MKKKVLIAIGGNSLIKSKDLQRVEDQHQAIRETITHVADLVEEGFQTLISHGNGPQVGFIMHRSEIALRAIGLHPVPLVNCVADTQGSIGYQIQQSLSNELADRGIKNNCACLVTQVVVDPDDPGFSIPSKPVGGFYNQKEAKDILQNYPDWTLVEDAGRGFRRVVPSPEPLEVIEKPIIESLLGDGYHVVAVGGGGIPVIQSNRGLVGVDAVIDKDLASSLLACQLGIKLLIISTAVEHVALNFGKPNEEAIKNINMNEAEQYVEEGHFAPGSMLPKIQASISFLKNGGREVIITAPEYIKDAVLEGRGTHIYG